VIKDILNDSRKNQIRSNRNILELSEILNYKQEAWQTGIREVQRVYGTIVGEKWDSSTMNEREVEMKKRIFFRVFAPLILHSNELILKDITRLERIKSIYQEKNTIPEKDQHWIMRHAELYRFDTSGSGISEKLLQELWEKADMIPPSLALSQGAEESGWGYFLFRGVGKCHRRTVDLGRECHQT